MTSDAFPRESPPTTEAIAQILKPLATELHGLRDFEGVVVRIRRLPEDCMHLDSVLCMERLEIVHPKPEPYLVKSPIPWKATIASHKPF